MVQGVSVVFREVDRDARLRIGSLKPLHVTEWIDGHNDWNATTRHRAVRSVKRVFNWAIREGRLSQSPVRSLERPAPKRREVFVTPEQYAAILKRISDVCFRDYITFLFETGARPQEGRLIEAVHCDVAAGRIVLPAAKAKGQQHPRLILLTPNAVTIVKRLCTAHPQGPIFRNSDGHPWIKNSVNCRFRRIRDKLKKSGMPIDGLCATAFRHGFATEALKQGVDPVTLSILMGHRDATQVARTYQHLAADAKHLNAALTAFRGQGDETTDGESSGE
ncbi:MAG: tyrosine-type recombinase/integrase [Planctomycetaceae bacterium]|nr:tyrosine-type recombinase/integrase [Planctomycetaceae bacterium]